MSIVKQNLAYGMRDKPVYPDNQGSELKTLSTRKLMVTVFLEREGVLC